MHEELLTESERVRQGVVFRIRCDEAGDDPQLVRRACLSAKPGQTFHVNGVCVERGAWDRDPELYGSTNPGGGRENFRIVSGSSFYSRTYGPFRGIDRTVVEIIGTSAERPEAAEGWETAPRSTSITKHRPGEHFHVRLTGGDLAPDEREAKFGTLTEALAYVSVRGFPDAPVREVWIGYRREGD